MSKVTKIYTKKGDDGTTSLIGGARVAKDHLRVEAYGTIDELSSIIGVVQSFYSEKENTLAQRNFENILNAIQRKLFEINAELATSPDYKGSKQNAIGGIDINWLEKIIDSMNEELPPLKNFILPGGSPLVALSHQARTVCRRSERIVISLSKIEKVNQHTIIYLNRLSDALFTFGRWIAFKLGENENYWQPLKEYPDLQF